MVPESETKTLLPLAERRLKVLHVGKFYPPHRGGIESHLQTLCDQLQGRVDLEVLVSNKRSRTRSELVNSIPVTRLACVATVASTSINPGLVAHIRRSRADIVHLHWPNPAALAAYLLSGHRARLVISYHSDVIRQRVLGRILEPMLQLSLQRSSAIIVASQNYVESSPSLRRHRERCRVIPYGIPEKHFNAPNPAAVNAIRSRFGERIVLSVGRLVYYKGFSQLIIAMANVPGRLLIAGSGPLETELMKLSQSLGLSERIVFLGSPDDQELHNLYHASDVFVLASIARSEAFGLVQAEAMAAGTPVVNTGLNSGVPFVSLHEVTGITVPPANPQALAAAINSLLDDSALRRQLGSSARHRARNQFHCSTMADSTLRTYESVMGVDARKSVAAYA